MLAGGTFGVEQTSNVAGAGTVTYDPGTTAQFNSATGTISRNMVMNGNTVSDAGHHHRPIILRGDYGEGIGVRDREACLDMGRGEHGAS